MKLVINAYESRLSKNRRRAIRASEGVNLCTTDRIELLIEKRCTWAK